METETSFFLRTNKSVTRSDSLVVLFCVGARRVNGNGYRKCNQPRNSFHNELMQAFYLHAYYKKRDAKKTVLFHRKISALKGAAWK